MSFFFFLGEGGDVSSWNNYIYSIGTLSFERQEQLPLFASKIINKMLINTIVSHSRVYANPWHGILIDSLLISRPLCHHLASLLVPMSPWSRYRETFVCMYVCMVWLFFQLVSKYYSELIYKQQLTNLC